jgi:hypothetical protein
MTISDFCNLLINNEPGEPWLDIFAGLDSGQVQPIYTSVIYKVIIKTKEDELNVLFSMSGNG